MLPTRRTHMVSARQTGEASPAHPLIRSLIPPLDRARHGPDRAPPAKDERSQLANYKGGC